MRLCRRCGASPVQARCRLRLLAASALLWSPSAVPTAMLLFWAYRRRHRSLAQLCTIPNPCTHMCTPFARPQRCTWARPASQPTLRAVQELLLTLLLSQALGKKLEAALHRLTWEAGSTMPPNLPLCCRICQAAGACQAQSHCIFMLLTLLIVLMGQRTLLAHDLTGLEGVS